MRTLLTLLIAFFLLAPPARALDCLPGDVHLDARVNADGTYVQEHCRKAANSSKNDNYSTRGNVNPYTGKKGTKPRDGERY